MKKFGIRHSGNLSFAEKQEFDSDLEAMEWLYGSWRDSNPTERLRNWELVELETGRIVCHGETVGA
jgi:hypothetical protein